MKLIPKYQEGTARDGILDNTRVNYSYSSRFRPLLVKGKSDLERWKEYRMLHDKNELIGPVLNVPEDLKKYYRRRGETLLWMDQRARNFESFGNLLNLTLPSTYVGQAMGRQLTGPEALAVDLLTGPVLGGIKAVGKKGVKAATKLATKGAEAYRRRFVYPREGLPQWFYTQKPLIARGTRPYTSPQSSGWRLLLLSESIMDESTRPTLTKKQFEYSFNQGRYKSFEDLLKYNISKENAQKLFDIANSIKKKIGKFSSENLKDKKNRALYDAILNNTENNMFRKKGARAAIEAVKNEEFLRSPEGLVYLIGQRKIPGTNETYMDRIRQSALETGINWADNQIDNPGTYMAGMSPELKLASVGNYTEPFILRYYENVINYIIGKGGFQEKILKSGDLRKNPITQQWEGKWPDGTWNPVRRPEEYIKARYAREVKRAEIELPKPVIGKNGVIYDNVPIHGTRNKDINYLQRASSNPGQDGYFTSVRDELYGESQVPGFYQDDGYGVPFFHMILKYVTEPFNGGSSLTLKLTLHELYPGKIMQPRNVLDGVPGLINEYDFSPTISNPKSMWNTLDFEKGAGPMAYQRQYNKERNNYA